MSCEHAKNHLAVQLLIYLLRSKNDEVSSSKSPFLLRSTKKKKKKSRKTNQYYKWNSKIIEKEI